MEILLLQIAGYLRMVTQGRSPSQTEAIELLDKIGAVLKAAEVESGAEVCKVRHAGKTDPPQDCDFPFCGCFSEATRAVEALIESGWARLDVAQRQKDFEAGFVMARSEFPWKPVDAFAAYMKGK